MKRAKFLAEKFLTDVKVTVSSRQFVTYTGSYKGTLMSVVLTGMGTPLTDFFIRETAYILEDEPMAVVRIGTCGIFNHDTPVATLMLSDDSIYCYKNYNYFDGEPGQEEKSSDRTGKKPYYLSGAVKADKHFVDLLEANLKARGATYKRGRNCSGETFFACQGRNFPGFSDANEHLVEEFKALNVDSVEMETHQLFHLLKERGQNSQDAPVSLSAAIAVGLVNRTNPNFNQHPTAEQIEKAVIAAGESAFDALATLASDGSLTKRSA